MIETYEICIQLHNLRAPAVEPKNLVCQIDNLPAFCVCQLHASPWPWTLRNIFWTEFLIEFCLESSDSLCSSQSTCLFILLLKGKHFLRSQRRRRSVHRCQSPGIERRVRHAEIGHGGVAAVCLVQSSLGELRKCGHLSHISYDIIS